MKASTIVLSCGILTAFLGSAASAAPAPDLTQGQGAVAETWGLLEQPVRAEIADEQFRLAGDNRKRRKRLARKKAAIRGNSASASEKTDQGDAAPAPATADAKPVTKKDVGKALFINGERVVRNGRKTTLTNEDAPDAQNLKQPVKGFYHVKSGR